MRKAFTVVGIGGGGFGTLGTLDIELEVDNEEYYSLLNVRREVSKWIF